MYFRDFNVIVDLGCGRGYVSKHLQKEMVKTLYQCDMSGLLLVSKLYCQSLKKAIL